MTQTSTATQTEPETLFAEVFDDGSEIDAHADGTVTIDLSMTGGARTMDADKATEFLHTLMDAILAARQA